MSSPKPRVRRVPVSLPATGTAQSGWLRNMRFSGFSVVMLGIIVLFVVVLAPSLRTLIQQQQEIAVARAQVAAARQDVTTKKKDVARWDDPAYIEAQARDRLLYVYPGETSYLVMGATAGGDRAATGDGTGGAVTTDAGTPVSTTLQTPKVDWVSGMLSSVLRSGLSDQTASKLIAPEVTGTGTGK
ncbi:FtsB family cell division protein [Curtobacterium sp. RRHDQ10]|uniref:FtsB family cell division protein n=1 Tax=Curtobacterium phyllosphaerae TaxID=3413379 RepID=UPI003BF1EE13